MSIAFPQSFVSMLPHMRKIPVPPEEKLLWYAVFPCGHKLDLGREVDQRPVAVFKYRGAAEDYARRTWDDGLAEVHPCLAPPQADMRLPGCDSAPDSATETRSADARLDAAENKISRHCGMLAAIESASRVEKSTISLYGTRPLHITTCPGGDWICFDARGTPVVTGHCSEDQVKIRNFIKAEKNREAITKLVDKLFSNAHLRCTGHPSK